MTILNLLKKDHEKVKELLSQIQESQDTKQRSALFKEFKTEMTAHNRAEEKVFYGRMEKHDETKQIALEGEEEHAVADRLIDSLARTSAKGSDRWSARAKVLKEIVEHHIREEEKEAFKKARKTFDAAALKEMGTEFEKRKQSLMQ